MSSPSPILVPGRLYISKKDMWLSGPHNTKTSDYDAIDFMMYSRPVFFQVGKIFVYVGNDYRLFRHLLPKSSIIVLNHYNKLFCVVLGPDGKHHYVEKSYFSSNFNPIKEKDL